MPELLPYIISGVFAVLWFLLKQKDAKQEESIRLLFQKHDEDAKALQELRLQIAEGHYKKTELDFKFEKLELAIVNSFNVLGGKFDKLSDVLVDHIRKEDGGGR